MNSFSCIITAGGVGNRFDDKQKKQFIELSGKPLINITIDIFYPLPEIKEIVVTLPSDEYDAAAAMLYKAFPHKVKCIIGGSTRQDSVYLALQHCDPSSKYVIIHDAVRPFLNKGDLYEMMESVEIYRAVITGSKVKNTLKMVKNGIILKTIQRENLVEVYTPQIFEQNLIKEYHQKARALNIHFTDDAGILEHFGMPVFLHETESCSLKITTKADLQYAEHLLSHHVVNQI